MSERFEKESNLSFGNRKLKQKVQWIKGEAQNRKKINIQKAIREKS